MLVEFVVHIERFLFVHVDRFVLADGLQTYTLSYVIKGIDVIHPIQKYTMEEKKIAEAHGDKICIWAGFDVQQTIPYGTPEEVRQEVRFMYDTYYRKDGRLILAAGNHLTPDTPFESLEALLDEALTYGTAIGKA